MTASAPAPCGNAPGQAGVIILWGNHDPGVSCGTRSFGTGGSCDLTDDLLLDSCLSDGTSPAFGRQEEAIAPDRPQSSRGAAA